MPIRSTTKISSKILLTTFVFSLFNFPAHSAKAAFSDLEANNKNFEAIIYLQENNVLNGYPDGTFKASKPVNRAEFLKIVIEGSKIPLDSDENVPFTDIDYGGWYIEYVQKAFSEGWINGYSDGTFKPGQTINKVEALKILAKAQKWPTDSINPESFTDLFSDIEITAWYTPYIAYAKTHGYLEETDDIFSPASLMTRGSISEVIYRSIVIPNEDLAKENATKIEAESTQIKSEVNKESLKTDSEIKETEELKTLVESDKESPTKESTANPNFTPVKFSNISATSYENITLSENLPNIFYQNEIYQISGDINFGDFNKATVILDSEDKTTHQAFIATTQNNHFEIPVHFRAPGNFYLGLLPGDNGQSKAYKISVLPSLPESGNLALAPPSSPKSMDVKFSSNQTSINFETENNTLKKLKFKQSSNSVFYYSRQNINKIPVNYRDFANFSAGEVIYELSSAYVSNQKPLELSSGFSENISKNLNAVEHSFDEINTEEISTTVSDTLPSPTPISITGTVKIDSKVEALVIKPDGFVDKVQLSSSVPTGTYFNTPIINSGSNFTFQYNPLTTGRYIIEINNKNSEATLNHPIYIGNIIPLIPDYFDLNERKPFKGNFDLKQERQTMLDLINKDRAKHNLNTVILTDDLNTLAQAHSEDMKINNFFGHYNLKNETPEDRRIALGIKTPVGENIAKDTSISSAHYGFMRSAAHRNNILIPEWTRLGLGIVLSDGHLIVTQEFSTSELTATDIANYRTELLNGINNKRLANSLSTLNVNNQLENAGKSLNDKAINNKTNLSNADFSSALNANNITGSSELIGRIGNPWKTLFDSIINEETTTLQNIWKLIGIDIQTDQIGKIHTLIILNNSN